MTWRVFPWEGGPWYWEVFSGGVKVNGGTAPDQARAVMIAAAHVFLARREMVMYGRGSAPYYLA